MTQTYTKVKMKSDDNLKIFPQSKKHTIMPKCKGEMCERCEYGTEREKEKRVHFRMSFSSDQIQAQPNEQKIE